MANHFFHQARLPACSRTFTVWKSGFRELRTRFHVVVFFLQPSEASARRAMKGLVLLALAAACVRGSELPARIGINDDGNIEISPLPGQQVRFGCSIYGRVTNECTHGGRRLSSSPLSCSLVFFREHARLVCPFACQLRFPTVVVRSTSCLFFRIHHA